MRRKYVQVTAVAVIVAAALVLAPVAASADVPPLTPGQVSHLVTVGIDGTKAGPSHAPALARAVRGTLVRVGAAATPTPVALVRVGKGEAQRAALRLQRHSAVLWAEPDTRLHAEAEPNDPCFQRTATCPGIGQVDQENMKVLHAPAAWSFTKGDPNLVV